MSCTVTPKNIIYLISKDKNLTFKDFSTIFLLLLLTQFPDRVTSQKAILMYRIINNICPNYLKKYILLTPPPRYPSGRVLASSAGGSGFNPQSRRYKNGTSSSLV